jgi:3,4-dihydroxy 2-butanone 4-phosphate synthase/GTP cyclohydrolase II
MARVPELIEFCREHDMRMISITDMIDYRRRTETLIDRKVGGVALPTEFGTFEAYAYESRCDHSEHVALVKGDVAGDDVLVRVHSSCCTGDTFGSLRCDCGPQLHESMARIEAEGRGVVLYLAQEGRGIGLVNKLKAYELQTAGMDTVDANLELGFGADLREYDFAAQVLADLGVKSVRLLTNNPRNIDALERLGLKVSERLSLEIDPVDANRSYLATKRDKLGHMLEHDDLSAAPSANGSLEATLSR